MASKDFPIALSVPLTREEYRNLKVRSRLQGRAMGQQARREMLAGINEAWEQPPPRRLNPSRRALAK